MAATDDHDARHDTIAEAQQRVAAARRELLEAVRAAYPQPVGEWTLRTSDGDPVSLAGLFGEHDDMLVVHNMGRHCRYCTMWADGFIGCTRHLERRCAFVLCSDDAPEDLRSHMRDRGWNFRCVSGAGSGFAEAMGFRTQDGKAMPGVSAFRRRPDGAVVRTGHAAFGPGDDFNPVWPLFELLEGGSAGFQPA